MSERREEKGEVGSHSSNHIPYVALRVSGRILADSSGRREALQESLR